MVAEDKFFSAGHLKIFRRRMPNWTIKMFAVQIIAIAMFMVASAYAPFCPKKYAHGKSSLSQLLTHTHSEVLFISI